MDDADLNRQFEVVCESVFGEMESQAVEALDLPGCFRMRSHSYLRAIQAGCSQDDDCLSVFSMSAPMMPTTTVSAIKPSTCKYRHWAWWSKPAFANWSDSSPSNSTDQSFRHTWSYSYWKVIQWLWKWSLSYTFQYLYAVLIRCTSFLNI